MEKAAEKREKSTLFERVLKEMVNYRQTFFGKDQMPDNDIGASKTQQQKIKIVPSGILEKHSVSPVIDHNASRM